jgi:hypothetical protein
MNHLKNPSNLFFEACPREVTLSLSAKGKPGTTEHYESTTLPIEEVVNMLSDHRVGNKNEWGWSPFDFRDDIRSRANAIGADFAVLDIDDGTPLGDIEGALGDAGIAALVTSTYSHLSKETDFRVSEYDAWRKRRPDAADEDFMRHHRKGFVEAVWRGSTIVRGRDKQLVTKVVRERGERVEKFTVRHAACEKYRVVVPLARTFLSNDYGDADAAWKAIVLALADDSGLKTDKQTLDRAHLFYGPLHPAGVRPARQFVQGEPFDWRMALALIRTARGRDGREGREPHQGASLARQSTLAAKVFNGHLALLREAIMSVRNDERFDDRGEWLKFLAAIHHETDGSDDGLELALDWSATWDSGGDNPAETERVWNSFRDDRERGATGATIRAYAARDGFRGPEGFVYGDGRVESSFDFKDERVAIQPDSRRRGLRFHYAGDLHRLPEATYLVKGLLFEGQLSCVYGQPGASKTFFALDVALHIALGRSWFGCDVKRGVVVYIALEGISGIRKRAEAACKHHGVKLASIPIVFAEGTADLSNDKGLPAQIADEAKRASDHFGFPIRTIVIDTLARAMNGDENSAKDMGALIAGADAIRMATGAHVCLVHHEGKDSDKGMRGSNALLGAVDTAIRIGRDKSNPRAFEGKITKQKEDEIGRPKRYTLDRVTLERCGEDGEPLTSAVVTPLSAIEFNDERMSAREREAVVILRRLADDSTDAFDDDEDGALVWIRVQKWKNALAESGWPTEENKTGADKGRTRATKGGGQGADNMRTRDSFERAFRRLRERLENTGIIETDGDSVAFAMGGADKGRT